MKRGELYRVFRGSRTDPKKTRVFVIVSRPVLVDSKFSTVTCAPIYTRTLGLSTQVNIGIEEGLKHESSIYCDELVSLRKSALTQYVGSLSAEKVRQLNEALKAALDLI